MGGIGKLREKYDFVSEIILLSQAIDHLYLMYCQLDFTNSTWQELKLGKVLYWVQVQD